MFDDVLKNAEPWGWLALAGIMGRLVFHARQVQNGMRKPFSAALLWDIPIGVGMGWMILGLSDYMDFKHSVAMSLAMVFSYLGPYTIDRFIALWADWKFGKSNDAAN